jgi:hypothetical protein
MPEKEMGDKSPELSADLDSQILFVEFMLQGYREETGQRMLNAIRNSLERLRESEKLGDGT